MPLSQRYQKIVDNAGLAILDTGTTRGLEWVWLDPRGEVNFFRHYGSVIVSAAIVGKKTLNFELSPDKDLQASRRLYRYFNGDRQALADELRSLGEAVIRPSEEDIAAIMALVRERPPDLDRQLAKYQVKFNPNDAELQAAKVPARCGLDGIVIGRLPKTPSDYRWLERLLRHELIHVGQLDRARKRGDVARMYQGAQKEIVLPSGQVNRHGYDENPQEIMAAAHDAVRRFREAGLSDEQIRQALEASGKGRSEAGRRRFLRYATDYLSSE